MRYERKDLKNGQKIWACAYKTNNTEKGMALKKKPVYGIVKIKSSDYWYGAYFYELNKIGNPIKSSRVSIHAREYSDTKEESTKIYNELVQKQIDFLNDLIDDCKKDFIKEND